MPGDGLFILLRFLGLESKRHGFNPWVEKIPLEEEMATHSSILAWKTPWTEEPDGL